MMTIKSVCVHGSIAARDAILRLKVWNLEDPDFKIIGDEGVPTCLGEFLHALLPP